MFEREYVEQLRADNPKLAASLEKSGELKVHVRRAGERAERLHEEVLASLLQEYPPTSTSDLERLGHLRSLQLMAKERVLSELRIPSAP